MVREIGTLLVSERGEREVGRDGGILYHGTPPKFESHSYGSTTSWDELGGVFSLFADVGRRRMLVDLFFLG